MQAEMAALQEIESLCDRARVLASDGDRAAYFLSASGTFQQGQSNLPQLTFNNPSDAHFYVDRINLYLSSRNVSLASPTTLTDLTYRPTDWVSVSLIDTNNAANLMKANATFILSDTNSEDSRYQNAAADVMSAFSGRHGSASAENTNLGAEITSTAYLGALVFHTEYLVKRGKSMVLAVSPNFSLPAPTSDPIIEFKITGVASGWKRVRAFR